jgi:two-component system, NtrC family, response regulator GlrR
LQSNQQSREHQGRRILVVDDEPAVCGAIRMLLEHDGHTVQTVTSGREALSLLEPGRFDVVITDYSMPEMKGDALAAAVKQRLPAQPVLMITAHAEMLKSSGTPLTGVDGLVNKPFLMEELREAIAGVLSKAG